MFRCSSILALGALCAALTLPPLIPPAGAAGQLARGVEGVHEVRNLLQVMPDTETTERQKVDDAALKETLKTMLVKDPALEESQVQVASVTNGVVLLAGKAATLSDQLRAIERTRDTPGVTHVASEI